MHVHCENIQLSSGEKVYLQRSKLGRLKQPGAAGTLPSNGLPARIILAISPAIVCAAITSSIAVA